MVYGDCTLIPPPSTMVMTRVCTPPAVASPRRHIVEESVITPSEWRRRYGLSRGAVFGLRHSLNQVRRPLMSLVPISSRTICCC